MKEIQKKSTLVQDLIVNSPLKLLHIFLKISCENLVLDQDNNLYLISLSILITCLLDNVWILKGEVTCQSPLEVERLTSWPVFLLSVGEEFL